MTGWRNARTNPEAQLDITNPTVTGTIAGDGGLTLVSKQTLVAWFQPVVYPMASYESTIVLTGDRSGVLGTIALTRTDFKDPLASETATGAIQRILR